LISAKKIVKGHGLLFLILLFSRERVAMCDAGSRQQQAKCTNL